jgi:hypothetical protein
MITQVPLGKIMKGRKIYNEREKITKGPFL